MKKLAIILILSILPLLASAQKIQITVGGGVSNTLFVADASPYIVEEPKGSYAGSFSATVGLPMGFRVGVSLSAYSFGYNYDIVVTDINAVKIGTQTQTVRYGNPAMPLEVIALKRFNRGAISIDAGLSGGVCLGNTSFNKVGIGKNAVIEKKDSSLWMVYGLVLGAQYNLGKRFLIGLDVLPKRITNSVGGTILCPVIAKVGISL